MKTTHKLALTLLASGFCATLAQAHPGHGTADLVSGLAHPIGGLDHLLAMLGIGLWASQQEGRLRWALPVGFVGALALGAAAGVGGVSLAGTELWIASSVAVLGALIALALRVPAGLALGLVAVAGGFHGLAHGAEMPVGGSMGSYLLGMVLMSGVLHGVGLLCGFGALQGRQAVLLRSVGACLAVAGLVLAV